VGAVDYLPSQERSFLSAMAKFRAGFLSDSDWNEHGGLLASGMFDWLSREQRLGLLLFGVEVDQASSRFELRT
jgi:hypothetical protein